MTGTQVITGEVPVIGTEPGVFPRWTPNRMRNCVAVIGGDAQWFTKHNRDEAIPVVGTVPGVFPRSTPNREPEFRARLMAAHRRTRYKREHKYRMKRYRLLGRCPGSSRGRPQTASLQNVQIGKITPWLWLTRKSRLMRDTKEVDADIDREPGYWDGAQGFPAVDPKPRA